jgi:hypothetical protein
MIAGWRWKHVAACLAGMVDGWRWKHASFETVMN